MKHLEVIRRFQCVDCPMFDLSNFPDCFTPYIYGVGCGRHVPVKTDGMTFYKGLPVGFNCMGDQLPESSEFLIFESWAEMAEAWGDLTGCLTVVGWKYLYEEAKITLIRVYQPVNNEGVNVMILEDCMDRCGGKRIGEDVVKKLSQAYGGEKDR